MALDEGGVELMAEDADGKVPNACEGPDVQDGDGAAGRCRRWCGSGERDCHAEQHGRDNGDQYAHAAKRAHLGTMAAFDGMEKRLKGLIVHGA